MEFFHEIDVTAGQAEIVARGMLAIARADGTVRPAEIELVKSFYSEVSAGGARHLASLVQAADLTPEVAATALTTRPLAELFLKSCILAGYADGSYTADERALVEEFAKGLRVDAPALSKLEQSVKEFLVSHLAGLSNVESVAGVAKKLGA